MKYYIQIKPKDKPNGLHLLSNIGNNAQYSTTEHLNEAISFESTKYDGLSHENFAFILFGLLGFKSSENNNELVSGFIIKLIDEKEIAQIQELATWKSTFAELPRNGECIAFRLQDTLGIIRKGYFVNSGNNSCGFYELIDDNNNKVSHSPYYQNKKDKEEILWKPLIY